MLPAIIGGIASIGSALIGGHGQAQANEANAREAANNRDFQERMRATSYQTAVEDMKKAGLNPALAYQQGGAGNLSGSTAVHQNPAQDAVNGAANAIQAFQSMRRTAAETDLIIEQKNKTFQERQILGYDELLRILDKEIAYGTSGDKIERIKAEAKQAVANAREADASAKITSLGIPEAEAIAAFYRTAMGKISPFITSGASVLGGISKLGALFSRGRSLRR